MSQPFQNCNGLIYVRDIPVYRAGMKWPIVLSWDEVAHCLSWDEVRQIVWFAHTHCWYRTHNED